jgi:Flp pilus assembly protein TadD
MKIEKSVVVLISIVTVILSFPASVAAQDTTDLYNSGLEHIRAQRWQQAIEVFNQAVAKNPKDGDAQFQLG